MKEFLKKGYRQGVRTLSYGLPDVVLFHCSLLLRRFGLGLKYVSAPAVVQRVTDFLFYNLRHMRPGLARTHLRGEEFSIQLNDPCQYDLVLGIHEPEVVQWMVSDLKEGMTFLDVGANVGYYTLLGARCVGASGKVVALEPDSEVFANLRRNIEANRVGNVQLVQGAACGTCGKVRLGRAISSSYSSGLYCQEAVDWMEVPAYSLDALVSQLDIGVVHLVKLDVEGAELETIEGMSKMLSVNRPKVIMELHGHLDETEIHPAVQKLKRAGYSVRSISRNHIVGEPAIAPSGNFGHRGFESTTK